HTATANDGSFDTGTITSSTAKSVTFSTAGTFAYHCKIHPAMAATVVVEAAAGGGASAPPTDSELAPTAPDTAPGWLLLVLAAIGGLWIATRRFARSSTSR
ncbi:MAG TPA: hypothetical protein VFJ71_05935, partial [Candidatus Limnocylindrales bacterium]|nr:hypothetical protein [Candidatus Limnocylindrales bacterium]